MKKIIMDFEERKQKELHEEEKRSKIRALEDEIERLKGEK